MNRLEHRLSRNLYRFMSHIAYESITLHFSAKIGHLPGSAGLLDLSNRTYQEVTCRRVASATRIFHRYSIAIDSHNWNFSTTTHLTILSPAIQFKHSTNKYKWQKIQNYFKCFHPLNIIKFWLVTFIKENLSSKIVKF